MKVRPAPETGDYFKEKLFRTYVTGPPRDALNVYGGVRRQRRSLDVCT